MIAVTETFCFSHQQLPSAVLDMLIITSIMNQSAMIIQLLETNIPGIHLKKELDPKELRELELPLLYNTSHHSSVCDSWWPSCGAPLWCTLWLSPDTAGSVQLLLLFTRLLTRNNIGTTLTSSPKLTMIVSTSPLNIFLVCVLTVSDVGIDFACTFKIFAATRDTSSISEDVRAGCGPGRDDPWAHAHTYSMWRQKQKQIWLQQTRRRQVINRGAGWSPCWVGLQTDLVHSLMSRNREQVDE